ncbi:uncharacterized protein METZ01_LOCUS166501 [marine metagenome]|uniref:Uncharacterized protein n=1 Tax=marine metagenome TaxID=408172 RepID=A0A382BKD3_9ZZZZ
MRSENCLGPVYNDTAGIIIGLINQYPGPDLNRHGRNGQWILSP